MIYHGFARRLHHTMPPWVEPGALFHVCIALHRDTEQHPLTDPALAHALLDSARYYEAKQRWHITLFILMPDHLHALLSFARDESMSCVIGDWKCFHARKNGVVWQQGYFDHRLRADERGVQLATKLNYMRRNPVVAGLCDKPEDWPWIIDPFARERRGGSTSPKTMPLLAEGAVKIWRQAASAANAPGDRVPPTESTLV